MIRSQRNSVHPMTAPNLRQLQHRDQLPRGDACALRDAQFRQGNIGGNIHEVCIGKNRKLRINRGSWELENMGISPDICPRFMKRLSLFLNSERNVGSRTVWNCVTVMRLWDPERVPMWCKLRFFSLPLTISRDSRESPLLRDGREQEGVLSNPRKFLRSGENMGGSLKFYPKGRGGSRNSTNVNGVK